MYRKISQTLLATNLVMLFATLWLFVPWCMSIFKNLKVEMPLPVLWLINASHYSMTPWGATTLLIAGFVIWKALDKWAAQKS